MLSTLYSAAGGLHSAEKTQEVLARNIALGSHHGYKRATLRFAEELQTAAATGTLSAKEGICFEQGQLLRTDAPLDIALQGDGFFTLRRPDGTTIYTRAGSFVLGADGRIATPSGLTLQGSSGPILLPPGSMVTIDEDGTVQNHGQPVDKLRITAFPDGSVLRRVGNTFFEEKGEVPTAMPAIDYQVRQGFLESSNVNVLREMVAMMENVRAFQANQKAAAAADTSMQQLNQAAEAT